MVFHLETLPQSMQINPPSSVFWTFDFIKSSSSKNYMICAFLKCAFLKLVYLDKLLNSVHIEFHLTKNVWLLHGNPQLRSILTWNHTKSSPKTENPAWPLNFWWLHSVLTKGVISNVLCWGIIIVWSINWSTLWLRLMCMASAALVLQTVGQWWQGKLSPGLCFDSIWCLITWRFLNTSLHTRQRQIDNPCSFTSWLMSLSSTASASRKKPTIITNYFTLCLLEMCMDNALYVGQVVSQKLQLYWTEICLVSRCCLALP